MSYGFLMDQGHREIAFKNQAEILADDFDVTGKGRGLNCHDRQVVAIKTTHPKHHWALKFLKAISLIGRISHLPTGKADAKAAYKIYLLRLIMVLFASLCLSVILVFDRSNSNYMLL